MLTLLLTPCEVVSFSQLTCKVDLGAIWHLGNPECSSLPQHNKGEKIRVSPVGIAEEKLVSAQICPSPSGYLF